MVITQNMIATGKLFTTNMVGFLFLEPAQERQLYLEFNVGAESPTRKHIQPPMNADERG
jgi:hypothetical protein